MKPATQEWIEKAEGDYRTALRERRVRRRPNHDAVCFHEEAKAAVKALEKVRKLIKNSMLDQQQKRK